MLSHLSVNDFTIAFLVGDCGEFLLRQQQLEASILSFFVGRKTSENQPPPGKDHAALNCESCFFSQMNFGKPIDC